MVRYSSMYVACVIWFCFIFVFLNPPNYTSVFHLFLFQLSCTSLLGLEIKIYELKDSRKQQLGFAIVSKLHAFHS